MRETQKSILEKLLEPLGHCLNEESARKVLALRADKKARARIEYLANKNTEGELTPQERAEYEVFVSIGNIVAILQAKARALLAKQSVH